LRVRAWFACRVNVFAASGGHQAENRRRLCMGLFSTFLFRGAPRLARLRPSGFAEAAFATIRLAKPKLREQRRLETRPGFEPG
jgi:hypothetical protein